MDKQNNGWKLTLGLSLLALAAAMVVPRLQPPAPEPDISADVCLRLGPYECCYKDEEP